MLLAFVPCELVRQYQSGWQGWRLQLLSAKRRQAEHARGAASPRGRRARRSRPRTRVGRTKAFEFVTRHYSSLLGTTHHYSSIVTRHTSLDTRHSSLITRHSPHVTRHSSHVTRHSRWWWWWFRRSFILVRHTVASSTDVRARLAPLAEKTRRARGRTDVPRRPTP